MTGFDSKRAAAAGKNDWRCSHGWLRGEQCEICNAPKPAQEPIAYVTGTYNGRFVVAPLNPAMVLPVGMAFYTAPPKREWVGLTDDDIESALPGYRAIDALDIYHAIEKALQEKNT